MTSNCTMELDSASIDSVSLRTSGSASLRASQSLQSNELTIVERTNRMKKLAAVRLEDLTINKLKIQSIGLIGRDTETERLQSCLRSMMEHQAAEDNDETEMNEETLPISKVKKELIFIQGFSGVGKTSIARTMKQELDSMEGGYYVEGKFDLNESMDKPYAGIAKAYSELVGELWAANPDMLFTVGQQLCDMLGSEVVPLTCLIPELESVVTEYSSYSDGNIDGIQARWKYSFRVLTRLLTSHVKPLVIMIDDLQWADKASLDLIETLITDSQNVSPLIIIGCYRSNAVDETSDLIKSIQSLEGKKLKFGFDIIDIEVESCGVHEVNQMIMKMMDTEDEESTRDLADLCFQRTLGNPFFVIEFMTMLQREDLIQFSIGTMKWSFDVEVIEDATMSTANVVELLKSRMEQMPPDVQLLLQVTACLGPTFRSSILETLWQNLPYIEAKGFGLQDVPRLLSFIESEMLIEAWAGDKYRWVHNKVQEAALSLVQVDEIALKFDLGKVLYFNLSGKEIDNELFDVADLISNGNKATESVGFASLCLKAAKRAKRLSAFQSTTRYVKIGIEMLPEDTWTSNQALTLELYTLGAQVELALGRVEDSKKYCAAVVMRKDVEVGLKTPLRLVEIKRLSTVELKYREAIEDCVALLKDMKYKFSRSLVPLQALRSLSRTIQVIKKQPTDLPLSMDEMDDKHKSIAEILNRMQYSSYHTKQIFQMILCDCHTAQLTLKCGVCEYSGPSFSSIGTYAVVLFQNYKDIPIFRELALSLQSRIGRARSCETVFKTYEYSMVWTMPLVSCGTIFYDTYIKGIQNGEVDYAMWCLLSHFVQLPWCLGKPIDQILEECPKIVAQMEDLSQTSQALITRCYWQMFSNLRKPQRDQHPFKLKGDVHSIDNPSEANPFVVVVDDYMECQLLLFYDHESAADRAIKGAAMLSKASPGNFEVMIETFHRGICLYVASRRKRRSRYRKHAKKIRNTMHKWKKVGIPNVVYYCTFLDAEDAALAGKHAEAEKNYKEAIVFAARSGILHHAALFNELYSDYLLRERGDRDEAKYRLQEALRYYMDWGALGKVEKLKESSLLA